MLQLILLYLIILLGANNQITDEEVDEETNTFDGMVIIDFFESFNSLILFIICIYIYVLITVSIIRITMEM